MMGSSDEGSENKKIRELVSVGNKDYFGNGDKSQSCYTIAKSD
jgi:hypothetical protein